MTLTNTKQWKKNITVKKNKEIKRKLSKLNTPIDVQYLLIS